MKIREMCMHLENRGVRCICQSNSLVCQERMKIFWRDISRQNGSGSGRKGRQETTGE